MNYLPWSNTAAHPSRLPERPDAIAEVVEMVAPGCGSAPGVREFIEKHGDSGAPLVCDHARCLGFGHNLARPQTHMSYAKDGQDMAVWSVPADGVIAVGRVQAFRCEDGPAYLAYWPNCGNVSRIVGWHEELPHPPTVREAWLWDRWASPFVLGPEDAPVGQVPEPGVLALILIGALAYKLTGVKK